MAPGNTETNPPAEPGSQHASFFRQSGWLMIANLAGGMLMWAVHFLAKKIPEGEYGNFGAFLAVVMVLPTIPLQMVLAQQTAWAIAHNRRGELSGLIRFFAWTTLVAWLIGATLVLVFQSHILTLWKVENAAALYLTLPVVLLSLWLPMAWGVLQGQQNFLWMGWSMMSNAIGRFGIAAFAVLVLHADAAGMLAGVLVGITIAFAITVWQTRSLWSVPPEPYNRRLILRQTIPLVLGFLGFQILFTADTMFVKAYFDESTAGFYVGAGTLARALMWFVLPLAAVMFPRIVHSAAKSETSNLMGMVLIGTGVLAIMGAASLVVLGPFVTRIVFTQSFVAVASAILPWYAAAMVPLAMANVLINNLFARPDSTFAPALSIFIVALGYLFALTQFNDELVTVLKVMGLFNVILLGVCAWFTWGVRTRVAQPPKPALPT
jgi:O-antigen/teichoic acid export membrane protein